MNNNSLGEVFAKDENYTIYMMGTDATSQYFACVPNELKGSVKVFIDLNKKGDLDMYRNIKDPMQRQELLTKINEVNKMINGMNKSGIYAMPLIDTTILTNLDEESKTEKYNDALKYIMNCTRDISQKLTSVDNAKASIEQVINIIEVNESDKKFVDWLKNQYPNYIAGTTLNDLRQQYYIELGMQAEQQNTNTNIMMESNQGLSNETIKDQAQANITNGTDAISLNNPQVNNEQQTNNVVNIDDYQNNQNQGVIAPTPVQTIESPNYVAEQNQNLNSGELSQTETNVQSNSQVIGMARKRVLAPQNRRAGFVKFPVFLLTILAIASIGLFVGKLFYMYLGQ